MFLYSTALKLQQPWTTQPLVMSPASKKKFANEI